MNLNIPKGMCVLVTFYTWGGGSTLLFYLLLKLFVSIFDH